MTDKIQQVVERFVDDLRAAMLDDVMAALGGAQKTPVRRTHAEVLLNRVGVKAPKATTNGALPKGQKRPPAELAALTERLGAAITNTPGLRIEQLAAQMVISTKELTLPVKKLLAEKLVRTEGVKRATKYFPAALRPLARVAKPAKRAKKRR